MKRKTSAKKPRASRPPSEAQLRALRASTAARRQTTIKRLQLAIDALTAKKAKITGQTIYEECGLRYAAIHRNREALALFRAHSTHLVAQKKRKRRKSTTAGEEMPAPRDPLLNYKKPQLVERLRAAQQQILELQQQLAVIVDTSEGPPAARNPFLNHTKPQLVDRLYAAQQQILELQQQLAVIVDTSLKREARIAELEAKLAQLEPYRAIVRQIRMQMRGEEFGRFGDLPALFE